MAKLLTYLGWTVATFGQYIKYMFIMNLTDNAVLACLTEYVHVYQLCPHNRMGGGHIAFGADPVGVGVGVRVGVSVGVGVRVRVARCLHSTSWTNWPNFHRHIIGREEKKWLNFGDVDLIFKVTPALLKFWPKKACLHPISWTKWRILAKLHIL